MNKRILWIDDDYYHIMGLVSPLRKLGFEIVNIGSFSGAKELLGNWHQYDVIILDLILPYADVCTMNQDIRFTESKDICSLILNGLDLFNYMKTNLKVNIPIIICSQVRNKLVDDLTKKGAIKCMFKSGLLPNELKRCVLDAINSTNK